jgi:hypothetical protein
LPTKMLECDCQKSRVLAYIFNTDMSMASPDS